MNSNSRRNSVVQWPDVFGIRNNAKLDKAPVHVQVINAGPAVPHVCPGNELFLHEIKTDEISVKYYNSEFQDAKSSWDSDNVEICLPVQYTEKFILYPRYATSHHFQSVQEILDTLPAVNKLIYPVNGFELPDRNVRGMERLEILDQIQDPYTETEMLSVYSVKNEKQFFLPASLKALFVQLSSDCYKCSQSGLLVKDFIGSWKAGDPPFRVKLLPSSNDQSPSSKSPIKTNKKDKKMNKKKHHSCTLENLDVTSLFSGHSSDRWLIPKEWWDRTLLIKPFQKIRVTNLNYDAKDFFLPDCSDMTVRLISSHGIGSANFQVEQLQERHRSFLGSDSELFSGSLDQIPLYSISQESPLLLMITSGSIATSLRQQPNLSAGHRLAIHQVKQSVKMIMRCPAGGQYFLVGMDYAGIFTRLPLTGHESDLTVGDLQGSILPCNVRVTRGDKNLGYDQLQKRKELYCMEVLTETTLIVNILSADGYITSEQPFEMSLMRSSDLTVRELDPHLFTSNCLRANMHNIKILSSVEFISDKEIAQLKKQDKKEENFSPVFPLQKGRGLSADMGSYPKTSPRKSFDHPVNLDIVGIDSTLPHPGPTPPLPSKSPMGEGRNFFGSVDLSPMKSSLPVPPRRPPKPERYKPERLSWQSGEHNVNGNNNSAIKPEMITTAKTDRVLERQRLRKKTTESDLKAVLLDSRELISKVSDDGLYCRMLPRQGVAERLEIPSNRDPPNISNKNLDKGRSLSRLEVKKGLMSFDMASASKYRTLETRRTSQVAFIPKQKQFKDMHHWFAPERADDYVLYRKEQLKRSMPPIPANNLEKATIGVYGDSESTSRNPKNKSQILTRGLRNLVRTQNNYVMTNPNYGQMINITYPQSEEDEDDPFEDYEFAADVKAPPSGSRHLIPSLVDDIEEYENCYSPKITPAE